MLTEKQARFVEEYLVDLNGAAAARRAGYSEDTARSIAHELLTKPDIQDAVAAAQEARSKRVQITADDVLRELVDIATVDANELIEHRVGCCRFCHGEGFRYQRTANELLRAEAANAAENEARIKKGDPIVLFDPEGGPGFHAHRVPHPDCPECFGEGSGRPIFKDTARASPAARRLYAGVKLTKDGMEMKLHSKLEAIGKLFDHLGMSSARRLEHTGKDGGAIEVANLPPRELARRIAFTLARGTLAAPTED